MPGAVVIGTYKKTAEARAVATRWATVVPDVVVVDRDQPRTGDPGTRERDILVT